MKKADFNKWYRQQVEHQTDDPPESLWEQLQYDLDIERVWSRLDQDLPKPKGFALWGSLAVAASILILASLGAWFMLGDRWLGKSVPTVSEQSDLMERISPGQDLSRLPARPIYSLPDIRPSSGFSPLSVGEARMEHLIPSDRIPITRALTGLSFLPPPIVFPGITGHLVTIPTISLTGIPKELKPSVKTRYAQLQDAAVPQLTDLSGTDKTKNTRIWRAGLSGQLANTWLLNTKTLNGLRSNDLTTTRPTFGNNAGIHLGLDWDHRWGLKIEWFFREQAGQRYEEYLHGHHVSSQLDLRYQSAVFLGRYQLMGAAPHHLALGLYGSWLQRARLMVNDTSRDVSHNYARHDLGVLAGYEYRQPLSNGLALETGIYIKTGLMNVFAGDVYIPAYLNSTQHAALVFSLSLSYQWK